MSVQTVRHGMGSGPGRIVLPANQIDNVKNYIALAALAEEQGMVALKMAMEQQAADEDEHGQTMQRLLGK